MAGLVFKWLKKGGGLAAIGERNQHQGRDAVRRHRRIAAVSEFGRKDARSWMNVTFTLTKPALDAVFLAAAAAAGLQGLKGHRVSGGMRASIYNAMPLAGVEKL